MEINTQWNLYYKIKDILHANFGKKFGIEDQANGKTICMIVSKSDVVLIKRINKYLKKNLDISVRSEDKLNANHGATGGTLVINISMFTPNSISLIEDLHNKLKINQNAKNMKKTSNIEITSGDNGQPESLILVGQKENEFLDPTVAHCSKYEFAKYLKSVLRFEGLDSKAFSIKKEGEDKLVLCSKNPYITKTAEEVINFYFGEKIASLYIGDNDYCIYFVSTRSQSAQAKKFSFCCSPEGKSDIKEMEKRLKRVFASNKYTISKVANSEFQFHVKFPVKGLADLRFALSDMGWKIKEDDGGFYVAVLPASKTEKEASINPKKDSKTIEASPSFKTGIVPSEKEVPMTRDEAYKKLCELVESEDFNLLDKTLQERILSKKEDYLKNKKREEVTIYAESLLEILN